MKIPNIISKIALMLIVFCFQIACKKSSDQSSSNSSNNSPVNLPSVTIGTQIWSSKNLDVDHYRNGDPIPQVTDPAQWANLTTGAWCYYNNDPAMGAIYGKLYNWYAVNDSRGLAPQGWHVPSDREWNILISFLDPSSDSSTYSYGQSSFAGGLLKSNNYWINGGNGSNASGFSGLPAGLRRYGPDAPFCYLGQQAYFWSASQDNRDRNYAIYRALNYNNNSVVYNPYYIFLGMSVRLIKD